MNVAIKKTAISYIVIFNLCVLLMAFTGCSKKLKTFNEFYAQGEYQEAADVYVSEKKMPEPGIHKVKSKKLLDYLQAAAAYRSAEEFSISNLLFDDCEVILKAQDQRSLGKKATQDTASVLVNDNVRDYEGTNYDGIMVNTYKALNFWQLGDKKLARVEFNRALDRQRIAKLKFSAEIRKREKEIKENQSTSDINKTLNDSSVRDQIREKYSNLDGFKVYPDFVNPFATYVSALFFMSEGDIPKARDQLKEVYGMTDENKIVGQDFQLLEEPNSQQKYVWVLFENGLGPIKDKFRIDLPLFLVGGHVKYAGIALPRLKYRRKAYTHLNLLSNGKCLGQTQSFCSMDRVIHTEFKKDFTKILIRAIISTAAKMAAQYAMDKSNDRNGDIASSIMAVYSFATNDADIRIWSALPKEFQIARVPIPEDGMLTIQTPSGRSVNFELSASQNAAIWVKIPSAGAKIVYGVLPM